MKRIYRHIKNHEPLYIGISAILALFLLWGFTIANEVTILEASVITLLYLVIIRLVFTEYKFLRELQKAKKDLENYDSNTQQ